MVSLILGGEQRREAHLSAANQTWKNKSKKSIGKVSEDSFSQVYIEFEHFTLYLYIYSNVRTSLIETVTPNCSPSMK